MKIQSYLQAVKLGMLLRALLYSVYIIFIKDTIHMYDIERFLIAVLLWTV